MREADTFEPEDDPHDETASEEDLPDETDAERIICMLCGNVVIFTKDMLGWDLWFCPECGD